MKFLILLLSLALFSSCSFLKKQHCNLDNATKQGYNTAMAGKQLEDGIGQAGRCEDFAAYSATMFRQDFKLGYERGVKQYCTDMNFQKWGTTDGAAGKDSHPNKYSQSMPICLARKEYKKKAEKIYKKSYYQAFQKTFCSDERMEEVAQKQANQFHKAKAPDLKKCKSASRLLKKFRSSYKEQMANNCTDAFWMMKAENDAAQKTTKSSQLAKIQMCPSSRRSTLTQLYSSAYNEKKQILLQEQQIALEKKRQQDMMKIEKEKLDLEKKKFQHTQDKDAGLHPGDRFDPSGKRWSYGATRIYRFKKDGQPLSASCMINRKTREARVTVRNPTSKVIRFSDTWRIEVYGHNRRLLKSQKKYKYLSLKPRGSQYVVEKYMPADASYCYAYLQ